MCADPMQLMSMLGQMGGGQAMAAEQIPTQPIPPQMPRQSQGNPAPIQAPPSAGVIPPGR